MTALRLVTPLLAVCWGCVACTKQKQPLFFKILLFGCASFLLGALFEGCWTLVYQTPPQGFHIGYLGYTGMFFFLLSAHFGAINRLADGGEKQFRPYRTAALIAPLLIVYITFRSVYKLGIAVNLPLLFLAIPLAFESYFALKHLLLPDVEMGIIRVMRPYNFCALMLCLSQLLSIAPIFSPTVQHYGSCAVCLFVVIALPLAEMGVKKWYI